MQMQTNDRVRYTVAEVQRSIFYQLPKFLFEEEFKGLSNDAKILYALLLNNHELSIKNKWFNANGEIYITFSRENMCELLGLSRPTVTKAMESLKKHKLVEEERIGLGRPNRIYLLTITTNKPLKVFTKKQPEASTGEMGCHETYQREYQEFSREQYRAFEVFETSESPENTVIEVSEKFLPCGEIKNLNQNANQISPNKNNINKNKEKNHLLSCMNSHGHSHGHSHEKMVINGSKENVDNFNVNNSLGNNVNRSTNRMVVSNSVVSSANKSMVGESQGGLRKGKGGDYQSAKRNQGSQGDLVQGNCSGVQDNYDVYREILKENIGYSCYVKHQKNDLEFVDELLDCMLDVICTEGAMVRIGGEDKNRNMVKSQYLKIGPKEIDHVMDRFRAQRHTITHLHSYLKTMLYTVKQEIGHYYTNAVRADGVV